MFGSKNGANIVGEGFLQKYGGKPGQFVGGLGRPLKRFSVMLVAETGEGELVGCCGMEMVLMSETGTAWWKGGVSESVIAIESCEKREDCFECAFVLAAII